MSVFLLMLACSSGWRRRRGRGAAGLAAGAAAARECVRHGAGSGDGGRWFCVGLRDPWVPTQAKADAWDAGPALLRGATCGISRAGRMSWMGWDFRSRRSRSKRRGASLVAPQGGARAVVKALASRATRAGSGSGPDVGRRDLARRRPVGGGGGRIPGRFRADRVVLATGGFMGDLSVARRRLDLDSAPLIGCARRGGRRGWRSRLRRAQRSPSGLPVSYTPMRCRILMSRTRPSC